MTLPVERKLLGEPIFRQQLVAEWEDLHHRNFRKNMRPNLLVWRRCLMAASCSQNAHNGTAPTIFSCS